MPTINPIIKNTRIKMIYQPFSFNLGRQFLNSFFPHFTKSWNNLENELQLETEHDVFKDKLKAKLKLRNINIFLRALKKGINSWPKLGWADHFWTPMHLQLACLIVHLVSVTESSQQSTFYFTVSFSLRSVRFCSVRCSNRSQIFTIIQTIRNSKFYFLA